MNTQIKNNLYFWDDEKIIYPAGYHAVVMDLKDKGQTFLSGVLEYTGLSCMALSPAKKKLALGLIGSRMDKDEKQAPPGIEIYEV